MGEGEWAVWRLADGDEVVRKGGGGWWIRDLNRSSINMAVQERKYSYVSTHCCVLGLILLSPLARSNYVLSRLFGDG